MDRFLAHRRKDDGAEQTVLEHLRGTAALARDFSAVFGAGDEGFRCGMLHDIGKYSCAFQRRIRGSSEKTDHATAGAQEAAKMNDFAASFCIAGHHGGLPNCGNFKVDSSSCPSLWGRLKRSLEDYSAFSQEVTIPPVQPGTALGTDDFANGFFVRMLFSCLVDADFLDTEAFMRPNAAVRGDYLPLADLLSSLEKHVAPWFPPESELNRMRCDVLSACETGGAAPPGLFTLTVPTGGGKTISSMMFALQHAVRHNKKRIIYVIPYVSIIKQTQDTFAKIFGQEQVVAHYSAADLSEKNEENDGVNPQELRRRLATENWDAPIIVTTAVQFFESLFANKTSRCRKLHNIAESVVILDEAQMLPTPYLRPCIAAIGELVRRYGTSAVLCTATQPALDSLLQEFLPGHPVPELCPNVTELFEKFRRVRYETLDKLALSELALRLSLREQVLCVVNRRSDAQEVFAALPPEGAYCLTTLMTPQHRTQALEEIRSRLKEALPCRVVSTSLIEAGVDVDFPTVYRAECGLDSLVQAAGRCNRENRRSAAESVVYSFRTEQMPPKMFAQNIAAAKIALENGADPDAPETQKRYFDVLYKTLKGAAALDQRQILPLLAGKSEEGMLPFATVGEVFRLIETAAKTVYIPLEQGEKLVEALRREGPTREVLRQLGSCGVSIYPEQLTPLLRTGAVETLHGEFFVLRDLRLYSPKTGLVPTVTEGEAFIV